MEQKDIIALIKRAEKIRNKAYAPYSHFLVGAALLCGSGRIYGGVNIENTSFPAGICAERSAFAAAVSSGEISFKAIAIIGKNINADKDNGEACYPCGICRQFMSELCKDDFYVISAKSTAQYEIHQLSELLPFSFDF